MDEKQNHVGKLMILSLSFFLLYSVFRTSQTLAAAVLDQLGFGKLGFYSSSALYFTLACSCFIATPIVNKCGERFSITLGALCYALYTSSFILSSASIKFDEQQSWYFEKDFIKAAILLGSCLNGFGGSIMWVAQGRYISRIATDQNKGTFNSVFWAVAMSCLMVGPLLGALVLENTDEFSFYCVMSSLGFLAVIFCLLLRPLPSHKVNDVSPSTATEEDGTVEQQKQPVLRRQKTVRDDMRETCKMLFTKRMCPLYPLIGCTSMIKAIYGSIFVRLMVNTMQDEEKWGVEDKQKTSKGLLCILGVGVGEIVGSIVFGRITDKCTTRSTCLLNVLATSISYGLVFLFTALYEFSFLLAFPMTFMWGVQDAGTVCVVTCMLCFQFESKTTPFSVYKCSQSIFVFVAYYVNSFIDTQNAYLVYFCISYAFSILAWIIFYKCFEFRSNETLESGLYTSQA